MAVADRLSEVDSYLEQLQHGRKPEIEMLRLLVLTAVPNLVERIKWNAPSYGLGQDDRVTMRLHPGDRLQLILHRGAKANADDFFRFEDPDGLIVWAAPDRGVVTLRDADDLAARSAALGRVIKRWVAMTTR